MNCQSFESVVNEIAREQMIDVSVRTEALEHGGECTHCGQRLADERAITASLSSLAAGFESVAAPPRVEASLLAAFDEHSFVRSRPLSISRSQYWIAAVAAVVLIVIGVSIARWRQPGSVSPPTDVRLVKNDAPPIAPIDPGTVSGTAGPRETLPGPAQPPRPSFTRKHRPGSSTPPPAANPGNSEIATDFLPVTYGGAANLSEGGRMFRVEMPRSAMATFGLPVNMDRANERVKADVLVGVDGLAHAIRFVR